MRLIDYPDRDALAMGVADALASDLRAALSTDGRATLAVPGGTTPGPVFDLLSGVDLDWPQVAVVPTDERWVAADSPRSNTRLVRERLLTGRAAAARLLPLYTPAPTPEDALPALSAALLPFLPLSVLLLGMGEDMHTASLFPGAEGLGPALDPRAPPLAALRSEAAGEPRVSLTAPVLTGAMHTHLMITGDAKRAAVDRARHLAPEAAPVRLVLGQATVHWAA